MLIRIWGARQPLLQWHVARRYSSYGRHFTKPEHLRYVSGKLQLFAQHGDTVVDFSCGSNEFVPLFKRECLAHGKQLTGRCFDIITPRDGEDFELVSWFDVQPGTKEGDAPLSSLSG